MEGTSSCFLCGALRCTRSKANQILRETIFSTICELFQLRFPNSCYQQILSEAQNYCDTCHLNLRELDKQIQIITKAEQSIIQTTTELKCRWVNYAKRRNNFQKAEKHELQKLEASENVSNYLRKFKRDPQMGFKMVTSSKLKIYLARADRRCAAQWQTYCSAH